MRLPMRGAVIAIASALLASTIAKAQPSSSVAGPGRTTATFRVIDFGAACDGKTDDTAAVQKAIDATEAAGGGVVEFPAGTCLLNSSRPSSHPWFFYNLIVGSNVTLSGTGGSRLLQGPGGRHALAPRATEVRNTVLAFGREYTVIRFQYPRYNGGFVTLRPTTAGETSVALSRSADLTRFKAEDDVAIYESTQGDVIPTEIGQVTAVKAENGVLTLRRPLTRSFLSPSIARITPLVTRNVGVRNMTVQGAEPLAVTETIGFKAENNEFVIETGTGERQFAGISLNTLVDFAFTGNTFTSVGPRYAPLELTQRNSRHGVFAGNRFTGLNAGFGEYAAHLKMTDNVFSLHPDATVVAGIFIGGKDVEFSRNTVHCGNITGGSGWGAVLADFIGPVEYAPYVGQIRITGNTLECRADGNICLGIFAADTAVIGNTIVATGTALGIHAEGALVQSNVIQDNTLRIGSGDGMFIVPPAKGGSGTKVTGNTIEGTGSHGIFVPAHGAPNAGGVVVSGNRVTGFKTAITIQ